MIGGFLSICAVLAAEWKDNMEFVMYEQEGFVGTITMNRPKALNALNLQMIDELDAVLDAVDLATTRCLILTGAGEKAFVAGADIGSMLPLTKEEGKRWGEHGNAVFRKLETLPIPVIAAVNGFALGGGCELAMACDFRIAGENAQFAQPETGLGIPPGFGGTQRLPRIVGEGMARELIYTGRRIDAQEALRTGLVNHVYPAGELLAEAKKLAGKIARNAPIGVRASKAAINRGAVTDLDSGIAFETVYFGSCFETEDQKEAMTAFVEKRKPEAFRNR